MTFTFKALRRLETNSASFRKSGLAGATSIDRPGACSFAGHGKLHHNPGLHQYAVFTACCTFLLLIAGALVTSNDAGLSIPDWPLAYGSLTPPMVGGIRYEFTHRVIATCIGFLTIILAAWLWRAEKRPWMRWLGLAALGGVIAQGILGGMTVRMFQPPPVSAAHATLAQLFFSTVVAIAVFTSSWWNGSSDGSGGSRHARASGPWWFGPPWPCSCN